MRQSNRPVLSMNFYEESRESVFGGQPYWEMIVHAKQESERLKVRVNQKIQRTMTNVTQILQMFPQTKSQQIISSKKQSKEKSVFYKYNPQYFVELSKKLEEINNLADNLQL